MKEVRKFRGGVSMESCSMGGRAIYAVDEDEVTSNTAAVEVDVRRRRDEGRSKLETSGLWRIESAVEWMAGVIGDPRS
jgi:hypothetical protein